VQDHLEMVEKDLEREHKLQEDGEKDLIMAME
jgi:hypothetical protein